MIRSSHRWLPATLGLGWAAAHGAILVDLDPATALYDSNVKGLVDDGGTAGSKSGIPALGDPEHLKGATFNIAFTPVAADLERVTPTAAKTVLLFEIGGSSNGFGLYLIDGVPTVLSKQGSNDQTVPASLNDTTLAAIAVQSPIGALTAGTPYSFSASWDQKGTLELKVQPDSGNVVFSSHFISGTPSNWSGNDTLSVAKITSVGSVGGLSGSNAANVLGPPFDVHNAYSFTGSVSRAVFWNAASVTAPVATAPAVLGFEATILPSTGKVRLHWKVTEGGAPNPTTLVLKAGATVVATPAFTDTFADIDPAGETSFSIIATNATGVTQKAATLAAETAFSAAVRADAPVAWFRFNDAAGSQLVADSADNATPHDGRAYGQSASGGTGFLDGAGVFDGSRGILTNSILDPGNLSSGFTVEAIVRRGPGVVGANPVVIGQRGSTGRLFLASPAGGKILTDIGGGIEKQADVPLHDDAWSHIAVVVDALHTEVRWYVDGVLAGSSADGLNPDGSTFDPNFLLEAATGDWIIGLGKALTGNYWKGGIDDIAVYNSVLDDPNGDEDHADSRIAAHRDAWWGTTAGILEYNASKTTVSSGDPVLLTARLGADITSVSIDHGVGTVSIVHGTATVTVNPSVTTTYQLTATGPGGSVTGSLTVTALQYQAPTVKSFHATRLATPGHVRFHWQVSEGEAPNPVTIEFKAGSTVLATSSTLSSFTDVDAGSETSFTLSAVNSTGTATATAVLDAETNFSAAVRADAPVAWFRFNEAAGSQVFVDSADNAAPHDAKAYGTPVSGVAGIVDGAVSLDGASAVVSDFILNPGQLESGFTIEAVVRRNPGTGTANHAIVGQGDLNGTGRILLSVTDDGTPRTLLGQAVAKDADVKLTADTWAHLVIVADALNTEVRWYLDGVLIGSTLDGTNPSGSTFDPNFIFEASEGVWNIGAQKSLTSDLWKGRIDEVVVYNGLLDDPDADGNTTDSRIAAHRTAWWQDAKGPLYEGVAASTITDGGSTNLTVKVGADVTSVSVDHGVGEVPLVNGNGVISLSPTTTTTYTVTYTTAAGTTTHAFTITVNAVPLKVTSSTIESGSLVLHFTGKPSTTYLVRGGLDLTTFDQDHGTVTTEADGTGTATVTLDPAKPRGFFRIETQP
ncbi:LamG domain-containing protein [Luteolibacter sp. LG18]|uniref:LamG domain-containing protein n=1 Tax=Luteolibacter sp. LG18 TaxID=2819286 RepID=UPI002B320BE7|nr:hypothetical protein llg_27980 [Luteolibacter sp. LG18]